VTPHLTVAYRNIAVPAATLVGAIVLISVTIIDVRRYRQAKALAKMDRMSNSP
jgi:hypothetical protein